MIKKEILKGTSAVVAAAIVTTSVALANPITVEAKVRTSVPQKSSYTLTIPEYVDDDYEAPAGYKVVDNMVVPIGGGKPINGKTITVNEAAPATSVTAMVPVATATVSDFNLNGTWTYLENSANNPVPAMVEQQGNVWVVAMFEGTSIVLGVNQGYGAEVVPTVLAQSTNTVAAAGNEAGIIIAAPTQGTDVVAYQLINSKTGQSATATTITIAVNVLPAAPGTGNGVMTNTGAVQAPTTSAASTTKKAVTDSEKEAEFVRLLNIERAKLGLQPLRMDSAANAVAQNVLQKIKVDFKHTTNMHMLNGGFLYEQISRGRYSAENAVMGFKNSWGHWVDLVDKYCDIIGVAYSNGYWVALPGTTSEAEAKHTDAVIKELKERCEEDSECVDIDDEDVFWSLEW